MRPRLRACRAHGGARGQTPPSSLPGPSLHLCFFSSAAIKTINRVGPQGSSQGSRAMFGKHIGCASWGLSTHYGQALRTQA